MRSIEIIRRAIGKKMGLPWRQVRVRLAMNREWDTLEMCVRGQWEPAVDPFGRFWTSPAQTLRANVKHALGQW